MSLPDKSEDKTSARLGRLWARLRGFGLRDAWWELLDLLEARRVLRWVTYAVGLLAVLSLVAAVWVYPWWRQKTAVSMATQWFESGKLDQASKSIQEALKVAPENPESWKLAADLARSLGNKKNAFNYSAKAAALAPEREDLALIWASDALISGQPDDATQAIETLPREALARSAPAQRILGELARRRADFSAAATHFENALTLEGPDTAINEIPLGVVLLQSSNRTFRQRGIELLAKWQSNLEWGANAVRSLLQDALARDDHPAMRKWADILRTHPRCTLGDIPNCLLALSKTDEVRFNEVVSVMEKNHAGDSANIALLVSWLNQIGRSEEALRWIKSLPSELTMRTPASVSIAESLRQSASWPALFDWVRNTQWGADLAPAQMNYQLLAARKTGRTELAQELWETLKSRAGTDGSRTLFTADLLYAWGLRDEAVTLLWIGADLPDIAANALGTLARHYQVQRDAEGQYQVFKKLHSLRQANADIANNLAYFAALTRKEIRTASDLSAANFKESPDNLVYRSTYAFVLCMQNQPDRALALLKPFAADWMNNPAMILPYGLALAGTGNQDAARTVLESLHGKTSTPEEEALIRNALK